MEIGWIYWFLAKSHQTEILERERCNIVARLKKIPLKYSTKHFMERENHNRKHLYGYWKWIGQDGIVHLVYHIWWVMLTEYAGDDNLDDDGGILLERWFGWRGVLICIILEARICLETNYFWWSGLISKLPKTLEIAYKFQSVSWGILPIYIF